MTKGSKPCASKHGFIDVKEVLTGVEQVDYVGDYANTIVIGAGRCVPVLFLINDDDSNIDISMALESLRAGDDVAEGALYGDAVREERLEELASRFPFAGGEGSVRSSPSSSASGASPGGSCDSFGVGLPPRSLVCSMQYGRVVPLCAPHVDVARGDRLGSVEGTHTEPPGPIPVSKKRGGGGR